MGYFGTDGIRNVAKIFFEDGFLYRFANAVTRTFGVDKVIIGRDTRESGEEILEGLMRSFNDLGVDTYDLGIVPTPEVCYYTREQTKAVGIMISASHNLPEYNGLKIIGNDGLKIGAEAEASMDKWIESRIMLLIMLYADRYSVDGAADYVRRITNGRGECFKGKKVLLDCAYGSASGVAREIFTRLGATVDSVCDGVEGSRINVDCGATHVENILNRHGYDIAFTYDGDADRVLASIDNVIKDGDDIVYTLALARGAKSVAVTKMTNHGLVTDLRNRGVKVVITDIGDKNIQEAVVGGEASIGAEQSGHIILAEEFPTGDGILASVEYLEAVINNPSAGFEKLAQSLININVDKMVLSDMDFSEATGEVERLGGRVLIRPSGTEELVRVLVEAKTKETAEHYSRAISNKIIEKSKLNS